jgi:hypothetical protein
MESAGKVARRSGQLMGWVNDNEGQLLAFTRPESDPHPDTSDEAPSTPYRARRWGSLDLDFPQIAYYALLSDCENVCLVAPAVSRSGSLDRAPNQGRPPYGVNFSRWRCRPARPVEFVLADVLAL